MRWIALLILLCLVGAKVGGCSNMAGAARKYTYPPDFRYISREQLQSAMWRLAYHWREVNRLMRLSDYPASHRAEIAGHLAAMDETAGRLGRLGWPSNHPLIDMKLDDFRRDLKLAREAIQRDPPNYILAAPITGACAYCHGGR